MIEHIRTVFREMTGVDVTNPEHLEDFVNRKVLQHADASVCNQPGKGEVGRSFLHCTFHDKLFEAGPDRGGSDIGGPFWTDFTVLAKAAEQQESSFAQIIQVVGHTIGSSIRTSRNIQSIGIGACCTYFEVGIFMFFE